LGNSKRVLKYLLPSLLVLLVVVSVSAMLLLKLGESKNETKATLDVNVGIAFCGNTTSEAKLLIDRVKSYTNLFILDSGGNPISQNQTVIEEICDYAIARDLKIIINLGHESTRSWFWNLASIEGVIQQWSQRWGDRFLGIYYNDEPGGIQLDGNWTEWFAQYGDRLNKTEHEPLYNVYIKMKEAEASGSAPAKYDEEAIFFVENFLRKDPGFVKLKAEGITTFTSDYCLYWFDYLGGYDVMFAQIGWNASVAQQLALVKGAARLQNKDWGAILTWKYYSPPYLDGGEQIYDQMLTSYQAGAKYIVIFNYPILEGNDYGALTDEHFDAIERFWDDVTDKEKSFDDLSGTGAALVLPENYGWGMRRPDDVIWGFWGPDEKSLQIGTVMSSLLAEYGVRLDIVYEDPTYHVSEGNYTKIYYWNSTDPVVPEPTSSPTPSPEPTTSPPLEHTFNVVNIYPHDANAFTQGLVFNNGYLYEGTGLNGNSSLRRVDLETGEVLQLFDLADQYFGEGIAIVDDKVIQLTWISHKGFVYDKQSFALLEEFSYATEGWGITYDGARLIMSDGTSTLYFLNPETFEVIGQVSVHDLDPVVHLNELEYVNGKIYANVWLEEKIAIINPQSGQVEAWIDLGGLQTQASQDPNSVLNGIAYDAEEDRLFVTGKLWSQLYEIKLVLLE